MTGAEALEKFNELQDRVRSFRSEHNRDPDDIDEIRESLHCLWWAISKEDKATVEILE